MGYRVSDHCHISLRRELTLSLLTVLKGVWNYAK